MARSPVAVDESIEKIRSLLTSFKIKRRKEEGGSGGGGHRCPAVCVYTAGPAGASPLPWPASPPTIRAKFFLVDPLGAQSAAPAPLSLFPFLIYFLVVVFDSIKTRDQTPRLRDTGGFMTFHSRPLTNGLFSEIRSFSTFPVSVAAVICYRRKTHSRK